MRGLFDRLAAGARVVPRNESIAAHLTALLNDRSILDLTDLVHVLPKGMSGVEQVIRQAVESHEPRLVRVTVRHVANADDPLRLDFQVEARLAEDPKRALRLRTWVRMPGRFHLG